MGKTSLVSMLSSGGKAFPKNYKMVRSAGLLCFHAAPLKEWVHHPLLPDLRLEPDRNTGIDTVVTCPALPDSMTEINTNRTIAACRPPAQSLCPLLSPQRMAPLQWNSCCLIQPALRSSQIFHWPAWLTATMWRWSMMSAVGTAFWNASGGLRSASALSTVQPIPDLMSWCKLH